MDKPLVFRNLLWFVTLLSFSLFFLFFVYAFDYSGLNSEIDRTTISLGRPANPISTQKPISLDNGIDTTKPISLAKHINTSKSVSPDPCLDRYIYVHDLPSRFNDDVIKNCTSLMKWLDLCPYLTNFGLGRRVENDPQGVLTKKSWFATEHFFLEVIFRERMKNYKCLTSDSSLASAIYIPFYPGLDVARHLWDYNISITDSLGLDLVKWLARQPEWKRMWGRDHFFVSGRIGWDFHRQTNYDSDWGSNLMTLPESMNMTMLTVESTPWSNEFAIPYPTYFHPSSDNEVRIWQNRMRKHKRQYLFSFAGARRRNMKDSIRDEIINQCLSAGGGCNFLDCYSNKKKCENPVEVIKVFQNSVFCLQPPGDSSTRRSTFDSILAGCIPVFFHPFSAYMQYLWHLPKVYWEYSVFIPLDLVKGEFGRSINKTLGDFPKNEVLAMREEIIKLIPSVIYAHPRSKLENVKDAFDIAVKEILKRIAKVRRKTKKGRDPSIGFAEYNVKLKQPLYIADGEWDHFY